MESAPGQSGGSGALSGLQIVLVQWPSSSLDGKVDALGIAAGERCRPSYERYRSVDRIIKERRELSNQQLDNLSSPIGRAPDERELKEERQRSNCRALSGLDCCDTSDFMLL